jgi:3-hydroxybutyryl-CoA dehydrogenase
VPVRTIAVIGAGTMGGGIAQIAATAGLNVILIDVGDAAIAKALDAIKGHLTDRVAKGRMTEAAKEAALGSIRGTTALEEIKPADLVIEATPESFEMKVKILNKIDALIREETIVASNTSSISVTRLAAAISHPDRVIGMHFFNPVPAMSLVEIVRGLQTSDATHNATEALALQLGKSPITVKSGPGFVVNRILLPMINEAFFVLAEGDAGPTEIDEGMKLGCNHPIGPLALADMIGLDVVLAIMQTLHDEFADSKYRPCPLLKEMVATGYLGRKTGRGVYRY